MEVPDTKKTATMTSIDQESASAVPSGTFDRRVDNIPFAGLGLRGFRVCGRRSGARQLY